MHPVSGEQLSQMFIDEIPEDMDYVVGRLEKYTSTYHSNCVSHIFYRVWQAVKSIFGKSDWQKANYFITKAYTNYQPELYSKKIKGLVDGVLTDLYNEINFIAKRLNISSISEGDKKDFESLHTKTLLSIKTLEDEVSKKALEAGFDQVEFLGPEDWK
jgi:hypothetical protein